MGFGEDWTQVFEISLDAPAGDPAEGNYPFFAALAETPHIADGKVDIFDFEAGYLSGPSSRGVEQFENGFITQTIRVLGAGGLKEGNNLISRAHTRQFFPGFGAFEAVGEVFLQQAGQNGKTQKHLDSHKPTVERGFTEISARLKIAVDCGWLDSFEILYVLRFAKLDKFKKIPAVGKDSISGKPGFDGHVVEE